MSWTYYGKGNLELFAHNFRIFIHSLEQILYNVARLYGWLVTGALRRCHTDASAKFSISQQFCTQCRTAESDC